MEINVPYCTISDFNQQIVSCSEREISNKFVL